MILVGASPLWFPWVVAVAARQAGVTLGSYERLGVSRLRLVDVKAATESVDFQAASFDIPQPLSWLRALASPPPAADPNPMWRLHDWNLQVRSATNTTPSSPAYDSLAAALDEVTGAQPHLAWLGGTFLAETGRVTAVARTFQVPRLLVTHQGIEASLAEGEKQASLSVSQVLPGHLEARLRLAPWDVQLTSTAIRTNLAWSLAGVLSHGTEQLRFQAVTDPGSWLPSLARIDADTWTLPLPEGLQGSVQLRVEADWSERKGAFAFGASGSLSPPGESSALPITAELTGQLSPESLQIDTLQADWQFARARLQRPVRTTLREPRSIPALEVAFEVSPDAVPQWGLSGRIHGTVSSEETTLDAIGRHLSVSVTSEGFTAYNVVLRRLLAQGTVDWPRLELDRLEITTAEEAELLASASADGATMALRRAEISFLGRLPGFLDTPALAWPALHITSTAQGPFTNLTLTGDLRSLDEATLGPLKPLSLGAQWRLRGRTLEDVTLHATQGPSAMRFRGNATVTANPILEFHGACSALEFQHDGLTNLALVSPASFTLQRTAPTNAPAGFRLQFPEARWEGQAGEVTASADSTWPGQGVFNATVHDLTPTFLSPWLREVPEWIAATRIHHLAAQGAWDHGPVDARASLDGTFVVPELGPVRITGSVLANHDGVQVDDWTVTHESGPGPRLSARIPVRLTPAQGAPGWQEQPDRALTGTLTLDQTAWPWQWIEKRTGVALRGPNARIELGGTLTEPELRLAWDTQQIQLRIPDWKGPPILLDRLAARAHVSSQSIVLDSVTLEVEGQKLSAEAVVPWQVTGTNAAWQARWTPDLERAEGHAEVPEASVAALTKPFENALQPGGTLRGRIDRRNAEWSGWLEVTNVTTRPLGGLGIVRDVDLRLVLLDQKIAIERGRAFLGSQPLTLSGAWSLPDQGQSDSTLRLSASNLALVRSPELLLRADLDLVVTSTNPAAPPLVGGTVTLHDSVVMMDVRDLVAVDLERPSQRPPFFSVDQPPLADWGLDLKVRGEHFARILSPILIASTSADLRLQGTLRQPRLVGQAYVDRGRLAFPFGQLDIQQFRVLFTESDPYRPRLEGRAEGLSFGYALSMDLGGTLATPEITFTSLPPMTTSQVLQMLMAGSLPRNEYSYSTTAKAQNVGTYLAGDLLSQLVGDPMEEPRLSIRSAERVSANGGLTYSVEYRLSDRWSAVAAYDRWSQLGAGVRWRAFEK